MKIFFDHKIFCEQVIGGASKYFLKLTQKLNETNVNAKIFAGFHLNKFLKEDSKKNNIGFEKKLAFSNYLVNTNFVPKLNKFNEILNLNFIKKFKPDIIHTTYYNGSFDRYSKPLVVTVYDLIHEIFYKSYGYKLPQFTKKNVLERADHVICISKSTANDLTKFYDVDPDKISITYLGVEKNFIISSNSPVDYPYILYVGNRHKYKNFQMFLKSLSINPKILQNFKIVLFGGGNLTKHEINLIRSYKIDPKKFSFYKGNNNLLNLFYQNARLLIYPSKYEGFGLPILEGFANNCPVICSNIPVFREVADQAAEYFDPNNADSIAQSISRVLFSDFIRNDLINKGKQRLKFFDWMKCALETKEIYKRLI
jgi:glycosyltransferase involved in cell wall biosynthesis